MSNPWFRMYAEFASDPVVQSLAFEDQRHYVIVLCLKCAGILDRNIDKSNRERVILRGLGLDPVAASEAKRRLTEVGLVDKEWQPIAWGKRQFISDTSTERVRKYRERKETGNVTETSTETFPSVSVSVSVDQKIVTPDGVDPQAWADICAYRTLPENRKAWGWSGLAQTKMAAVLAKYSPAAQREMVDKAIRNGWRGVWADQKSASEKVPYLE